MRSDSFQGYVLNPFVLSRNGYTVQCLSVHRLVVWRVVQHTLMALNRKKYKCCIKCNPLALNTEILPTALCHSPSLYTSKKQLGHSVSFDGPTIRNDLAQNMHVAASVAQNMHVAASIAQNMHVTVLIAQNMLVTVLLATYVNISLWQSLPTLHSTK